MKRRKTDHDIRTAAETKQDYLIVNDYVFKLCKKYNLNYVFGMKVVKDKKLKEK